MIRSFKKMQRTHMRALDGYVGKLSDIFFDDRTWKVRYFVAEFSDWFLEKDVLVSPSAISTFDGTSLNIALTKAEMRACPRAGSSQEVDPHLQSCKNLCSFELICKDEDIGAMHDLLVDDSLWLIRFLIAKISDGNILEEKLLGPQLVEDIEWRLSTVILGINRRKTLSKPRFDASRHLDTSYETLLRELYESDKSFSLK